MRGRDRLRELHRRQGRVYQGAGIDAVAELLAKDVVWHVPGASPIAGRHRGIDAVLEYFERRRDLARASMRITVHGELESADTVAVLAGGAIEASGAAASWETAGVYRFAGDLLAEAWLVPLDPERFDAVWVALEQGVEPPAVSPGRPKPLPGATVTRAGEMTSETLELGSVVVARHHVPAGFDSAPLYRALPGGMCPCEHLCMLESGSLTYRFATGERRPMPPGEACHVTAGHLADVHDDARLVELTPREQYAMKAEAIEQQARTS